MTVIHCDIKGGTTTPATDNTRFNNLKVMVDTATSLNIKLSIMVNPYFCQIILSDPSKFSAVQTWQANGHEIAGLHRGLTHYEWDGYTDLPPDTVNAYNSMANYLGPMRVFFNWLDSIAVNPIHLYATYDVVSEFDWKPSAYIQGDGDGPTAPASSAYFNVVSSTVNKGSIDVCKVKYYFIDTPAKVNSVTSLFASRSEQNVGVVTHQTNFAANPAYFYQWLNFVAAQQSSGNGFSKTATEIVQASSCRSVLSIENDSLLEETAVYPNPTSHILHINTKNKSLDIKIYDAYGNLVHHSQAKNSIDVRHLPSGMYLLVLSDGKNFISKKIHTQ